MSNADSRGQRKSLRRLPSLMNSDSPTKKLRGLRDRLIHEALEDRVLLDARLNLFVNGVREVIPKDVGIAPGVVAPVHSHNVSGEIHFNPSESTTQLPGGRPANLGDFFQIWRTNAGNAGNNPNAIFTSTNLLGHQTDANHVIRMFVNGVPNTQYENYVMRDNDEITIMYDTVQGGLNPNAPVLMPIDNYYTTTGSGASQAWGRTDRVDMLAGSPLYLPLDGYDPNGQPITYSVTSSTPSISTYIPQGNRSMRITTNRLGTMTFQLFDDRAPRATNRIAELAQSGFYNGVIFHRVIDNFMIQGGDPTGTGTGGSDLGDFDDQFHLDLQHNRSGLLSMAKSNDDTNDSQFFITDVATRNLDFNHTVFGMLVEGDFTRDEIGSTPANPADTTQSGQNPDGLQDNKPIKDVIMDTVEIFTDTENGVLMLKAAAGFTGTATITVSARDSSGNTTSRQFTVNVTADTTNGGPFLNDFNTNITTPHNTATTGTLVGVDAENDAMYYDAAPVPPSGGWTFNVSNSSGAWTFTPQTGHAGIFSQLVGVRPTTQSNTGQGFDFDIEEILFTVQPPTQATAGQAYTVNVQTPEELFTTKPAGFAYSLVNQPQGMTINATTGEINWTPAANQAGTYNYEVRATNTSGNSATPNRTMQFSVTLAGAVSVPTAVDLAAASDSGSNNSDNLTNVTLPQFTVTGVTSGAVVRLYNGNNVIGQATASGSTVTITATTALTSGSNNITATQQPSGGQETGKSASLLVTFDNTIPGNFSTTPSGSAITGRGYVFDVQSADEASGNVAYSLQNSPSGMAIAPSTGVITWVPTSAQNGNQSFTIRITDKAGNVRTQSASLNVAPQTLSPMPGFDLSDANPNSPTSGQSVSLNEFQNHVSAWYLIHST
jgi:cyclophilin family peptidyl-prolyl cis-trans isomerase